MNTPNMLGEAKMVFSANLQETLGISWYEGLLVDTIPMVPDRLSYKEMATEDFKYPSVWTESFESYKKHKNEVCDRIVEYIENYEKYIVSYAEANTFTNDDFSGKALYKAIKDE